ncbi:MAG: MFS transporter [Bacteroidetes bacterium]|nr:MFS transporter [Bacteroidota bacterium]
MPLFKLNSEKLEVLQNKHFLFFSLSRFLLTIAIQMQSILVGWQVYEYTKDALSLGLIGLAEIIPFITIILFAGHIADIFNRKKIILIALIFYLFTSTGFLLLSLNSFEYLNYFGIFSVYVLIGLTGIIRAFLGPSYFALLSQVVEKKHYATAATWNSSVWQIGAVIGPALGGIVFSYTNYVFSYGLVIFLFTISLISALLLPMIKSNAVENKREPIFKSISKGIRFVFKSNIVLPAISLDLFAVLFGGAVALLPIYADQILHTGAIGLGWLRAAPSIGAVIMALVLAFFPPLKNAGKKLVVAVIGFGITIILFGISTNFYFSFTVLLLGGAFDNISVVIRHTILQLYTPDEMRGRVSAVNSIFIGSSNEIGQFESGAAAKLVGLVPSVIIGGSITIATALATIKLAPTLIKLNLSATNENK